MSDKKNPVVQTAKEVTTKNGANNIVNVNGVRVKLTPVSSTLIDAVTNKIKDPPVPTWMNPDKEREEPNPNDPEYLAELAEANRKRGLAALDALAMFGIEMIDPIPENRSWVRKLTILGVDMSGYDLEDALDIEFLYKRFFIATNDVIERISEVSGISPDEVAQAEATFSGN